jgi:hypothetical protein
MKRTEFRVGFKGCLAISPSVLRRLLGRSTQESVQIQYQVGEANSESYTGVFPGDEGGTAVQYLRLGVILCLE